MNKRNLITMVSERVGCPQTHVEKLLDPILECIRDELIKNEKITINNFGTFMVKDMKARNSRNPSTGKAIVVEAKKVVKFKASPNIFEKKK